MALVRTTALRSLRNRYPQRCLVLADPKAACNQRRPNSGQRLPRLVCSAAPCDVPFERLMMGGGDEMERRAAIVRRLPDSYRKIVRSE